MDRLAIPEEASAGLIFSALDMAHIAAMLVFFILLGFLPGTQGTNRFGPAPNSRQENYRAPMVD